MRFIQLTAKNADLYFDTWLHMYQDPKINPFFFKPLHEPREVMRQAYNGYIKNPNIRFLLYANDNHEIVATCRITYFTEARSHVAMINALATRSDMQGKGYATSMLNEIENFVKVDNPSVNQLELAWEGDNRAGYKLYIRNAKYLQKIIYRNWWIRHEEELKKDYPWYTSERCCVKYLNEVPEECKDLINKYSQVNLNGANKLPEAYKVLSVTDKDKIKNLIGPIARTYTDKEQEELYKIIAQQQHAYFLQSEDKILAVISFRAYSEPRLDHAVTIPLIAFLDDVKDELVSSFIYQSLQYYREKNEKTFHFACSEEDTEEIWYTDKHSKIERLPKILINAGFEFAGVFENYFNETSHSGRNLLGFQICLLGLDAAQECVNASMLDHYSKIQLKHALKNLQDSKDKLTYPEQQWIYNMVRMIVHTDHCEVAELKNYLQIALEQFKTLSPNCSHVENELNKLNSMLQQIVNQRFLNSIEKTGFFYPKSNLITANRCTLSNTNSPKFNIF